MSLIDSTNEAPQELPTAEEDLGPRPSRPAVGAQADDLPTAEDDLGPRPNRPRPVTGTVAPGPLGDWLFGDTKQSSLARIMRAFGETVHQDVGDWGDKLYMSEDTKKFLRERGIFNDYVNGQASVLKAYNETFLRAGAVAVNTAMYGVPAVIHGAQEAVAEAGRQAQNTEIGKTVGAGKLSRDIAALPEAFPTFEHPNLPHPPVPEALAPARDLNVIGPGGEAAWLGTAKTESEAVASPVAQEALPAEAPAAPDIHAKAREIAPEAIDEFATLEKRRVSLIQWLDERPEGAQVEGAPREVIADTLKATETRLREIEPAVSAAYDKAREGLPAETPAEAPPEAPTPPGEPAQAARPIEDQRDYIVQDAKRQLKAAGRPEDEAAAVAQLIAARYETRAARMGGALGTPEELYDREAAEIRGQQIARKVTTPAAARALDDFQERMAQGKDAAKKRRDEGTGGGKVVSTAEKYAGTTVVDEKAWRDAEERATYGLEPEEREQVHAVLDSIPADDRDWIARLPKDFFQRPFDGPHVLRDLEGNTISAHASREEAEAARDTTLRNAWETQGDTFDEVPKREWDRAVNEWNADKPKDERIHPSEIEALTGLPYDLKTKLEQLHNQYLDQIKPYPGAEKASKYFADSGREEDLRFALKVRPAKEAPENELNQRAQGKVTFAEGKRPVITLMRSADASTAVHELGHEWLEQMLRDAEHEKAPEGLKSDRDTVFKWFGIDKAEDLETRHHEKFARGFEQYLREGVAPSKQLAKVFAKFKEWLTRIYQTLKGLGEPISDDIRRVFERMLEQNPERVAIAPERESVPDFHERHAAAAETIAEEHARDVSGEIQAERDSIADQNVVGLGNADARLENVEPRVGVRAPGAAQLASDADAAGDRGAPGASPQVGSELPGGGEAAPKGAGVLPEARGDVSNPNSGFETPSTDLIDKAGNIRLDKLNQAADVDEVIRQAARNNNAFLQERRGVLSDGTTLDLADALGMDPSFLDRKKIGDAYNVEEIRAARRLLVKSAENVRDLMIAAKDGGQEALQKLAEGIARHEMIQGKVSGATAEAGRALRAFREVLPGQTDQLNLDYFLKTHTGRTLFQLQQMAQFGSQLKDPAQVSRFVFDTKNGKIKQAVLYYYVNSLISGPITHTRYFAGNALTAMWAPVKTTMAAGIDTGATAFGLQDGRRIFFGEAGAEIYALGKGSREGWKAAGEGWRTGNTPHLPGEAPPQLFEAQPIAPAIPGKIGQVIGFPGKAVGAIHGFSSAVRYEQEIAKLAYRQAMREGLTGDAFNNRVADLGNRPTPEMTEAAARVARKDLYMAPADYASLEAKIGRFANHNIVTKLILPFTKIGTQIATQALENSPAGLFMGKVRENLSGKNGIEARNTQMASIVASTGLMGFMGGLAAEGMATGAGPADPQQNRVWRLTHNPYSIMVGGVSIPYRGLGMLGMQMSIATNAYETYHGFPEPGNEHEQNLVASWLEAFVKSVLGDSWLRGVKDMIDAMFHPEEYGDRYVSNMVTNWVPFSIGLSQINRAFVDPYQRETRGNTTLESIAKEAQAKVPFWSQSLMPRRDQFGEPIPSSGTVQSYANDPVAKMMDELHFKSSPIPRKVRGIELTDQQHDQFAMLAGRLAKIALDKKLATPGFAALPPAMRIERMSAIIRIAREKAENTVMMNAYGGDNDVLHKATEQKKIKRGLVPDTVH